MRLGNVLFRFCLDFVKTFVHANIPLEKAVKFKSFLEMYTNQDGTLPGADTLRREYLPLLLPPHKEALKQLLFDKKVYIVADESTDSYQRSVLVTLAIQKAKVNLILLV